MNFGSTKKIVTLCLLVVSLFTFTACNEQGLTFAISTLSSAATVQSVAVTSLLTDGQITQEDADQFLAWAKPIPAACDAATEVLASSDSMEVKLTKIGNIFAVVHQPVVFRSDVSPRFKLAYALITASLDAAARQLKVAQAQAARKAAQKT